MTLSRRQSLEALGGLGLQAALLAIGLLPEGAHAQAAQAFDRAAFGARTIGEALKALGALAPTESKDVLITAPEIAEDGAVVPVSIRSAIPGTDSIALLVDRNPNALAAVYRLLEGAQPEIGMRVKMSESSDVVAIVRAGGRHYMARKQVKVTLGGCGG